MNGFRDNMSPSQSCESRNMSGQLDQLPYILIHKERVIYIYKTAANIKSSATSSEGGDRPCKAKVGGSSGLRVTYADGADRGKVGDSSKRFYRHLCVYRYA